jgi:plasmid stability protein
MAKKMISLEISDELREALRIEAFKRSLSISALIRQLLEKALKESLDEGQKPYEQNY